MNITDIARVITEDPDQFNDVEYAIYPTDHYTYLAILSESHRIPEEIGEIIRRFGLEELSEGLYQVHPSDAAGVEEALSAVAVKGERAAEFLAYLDEKGYFDEEISGSPYHSKGPYPSPESEVGQDPAYDDLEDTDDFGIDWERQGQDQMLDFRCPKCRQIKPGNEQDYSTGLCRDCI